MPNHTNEGRSVARTSPETAPMATMQMSEPEVDAVVLVHGEFGTAYQRFLRDGLWHGTNGRVVLWADILKMSNTRLPIILSNPNA